MSKRNRDFKQSVIDATKQPKDPRFPAMLGNTSGTVIYSGQLVYVTNMYSGQVQIVKNTSVANSPGMLVMVGKKDGSSSLEVLYAINQNTSFPISDDISTLISRHGSTHTYPSYDTVFVKAEQFIPLLVLPTSDLTVRVYPGTVAKRGGDGYAFCSGNTALDLSSHQPASGARWLLLEINDSGTIIETEGPIYANRNLLTGANIPTVTHTAICAIVLDSSYGVLERSNSRSDFWDLRFAVDIPYINAANIPYYPYVSGDWIWYLVPEPDDIEGALDILAARVTDLETVFPPDASQVTYTPGDLDDWDYMADPGEVLQALNQLASRVKDIEGVLSQVVAALGL